MKYSVAVTVEAQLNLNFYGFWLVAPYVWYFTNPFLFP